MIYIASDVTLEDLDSLNRARTTLDSFMEKYGALPREKTDEMLLELIDFMLQMQIYVVDMLEVLLLLRSGNENSFSTKTTCRLVILRALERLYSLGSAYGSLKDIAVYAGIEDGFAAYLDTSKKYKSERKLLEGMASIRHTAGHYFNDATLFIREINSVRVSDVEERVSAVVQIARALHSFGDHLITNWPTNKRLRQPLKA